MSAFDGLTFKQGLTKVGYPDDQAEALSALIRDHVVGNAATKEDLLHTEQRLNAKIDRIEERLRAEINTLGQKMTIQLGSMSIAGVVIILTAMAFLI
ncbi:MAG: CCDC90 family protein [Pseudomonadota bacterium]|nr:CCDC90 family protein [Pseudomonadota bacterium]